MCEEESTYQLTLVARLRKRVTTSCACACPSATVTCAGSSKAPASCVRAYLADALAGGFVVAQPAQTRLSCALVRVRPLLGLLRTPGWSAWSRPHPAEQPVLLCQTSRFRLALQLSRIGVWTCLWLSCPLQATEAGAMRSRG